MEEKLDLILSKITGIESELKQVNVRLDKLEEGQNSLKTELKKDIKDLSTMLVTSASRFDTLDTEIAGINKKLDRLSARQDIFSATVKEHELRLEDLEISPPIK
ncbi:MAG: hypothetical protein ABRQ37_22780 [Candidatus Eremiobacterota bacterium]